MVNPKTETEELFVDLDHLTVGEIEIIEEKSGLSIDMLAQPNVPKGKLMRAIVYILKRRNDPDFTYEDAGNYRLQFGNAVTNGEVPVPPTQSGDLPQLQSSQSTTVNPFPKSSPSNFGS